MQQPLPDSETRSATEQISRSLACWAGLHYVFVFFFGMLKAALVSNQSHYWCSSHYVWSPGSEVPGDDMYFQEILLSADVMKPR